MRLALLCLFTLLLAGCASQSTDSNSQPVSSIPWNRPERWEGQGQLGGMMGQ